MQNITTDNQIETTLRTAYKEQSVGNYKEAYQLLEALAMNNIARAQNELANLYLNNITSFYNIEKAIYWYTKASQNNGYESDYNLARLYHTKKEVQNYKKAKELYLELTTRDNGTWLGDVSFHLAQMYEKGEGTTTDLEEALNWYIKSANVGQTDSQYHLALIYNNTSSIHYNKEKATFWFNEAAAKGNIDAQYYLIQIYSQDSSTYKQYYQDAKAFLSLMKKDKNIPIEPNDAFTWYTKLAAKGNTLAQYFLGHIYHRYTNTQEGELTAINWFKKAASHGSADAMYYIGWIHIYTSVDDHMDAKEAFKWYKKAAEHGHVKGQTKIAIWYYQGRLIPKDYKASVYWLKKASKQGHPRAKEFLAIAYQNGFGLKKNSQKALALFKEIHNLGRKHFSYQIFNIYNDIESTLYNQDKAIQWCRLSADEGNSRGEFHLGLFYFHGQLIEKDIEKTLYWWERSAEHGFSHANWTLGCLYFFKSEVKTNYQKAIQYFEKSAEKYNQKSLIQLIKTYCEGKGVPQDLEVASYWAKKALKKDFDISEFTNEYELNLEA